MKPIRTGLPSLCSATIGLLLFTSVSAPAALTLASKGKTDYQIVVPAAALPSERYAAEELQKYLEKITGAKMPIVTDTEKARSKEILLGDNARLRRVEPKLNCEHLATDAFVLRTRGKRLIIAGSKPRGTLYGVYALLEEQLGVRWFTPEFEHVPRAAKLSLKALDETHTPGFEYREVFWTEMMRDGDFAAKHRLNGNHYKLTDRHGGRFVVYHPFVHSFDALIPRDLFKEHPEYFPMIKGERKGGYVQRCLTNPDVLKLAIERVRQWIKDNPQATIISVSQNDTINNCQCEKCKALDDAEGSPAASLLQFVNAIAENIEHDYPNVRIDTLAYQYTRKPPKTIQPRRNVIVRLCSIECCFAHSFETCTSPENRRFRDDIIAWQPVAPLLYVWDYTPNFAHYQQPFPNLDSLQPNVQFFANHGVKGLFEQGNYSGGGNGELGPLRAYVLAKLLWDPQTDAKKHTTEFVNAYYGQAAVKFAAYLDLLQQQVRAGKPHAHIFDRSTAAYLDDGFLSSGDQLLAEAEQSAENETVRFRVQVARLPVWYVQMVTDRVTGEARKDLLAKFLAIARRAGISNISEGQSLEDWAKKMGNK
jgi:hypothetical protein